ncbi:tumor protein p63-regulated gene 1 protein [Eublepharis macularius]|uniref:Tumor protein p63-regulated gene 1 protein n=1 Tax=Eublepharis macularius TaxID=481883 RepID=A0AA97L2U8_EUBMA|nr:tumor protein p63-regulated gene 1 protein [Eublepharis macularius]
MSYGRSDPEFQTVEMQKEQEDTSKGNASTGNAAETQPDAAASSASRGFRYPGPHRDQYEARKYFVTRAGAFDQAVEDLKAHVIENMGETAHGFWLLTEIDHWNNEKERIVVITDSSLLICKYDFIMLKCLQLQRIPLGDINRICMGSFTFPERSLDRREGEGLRIYWTKQQEPDFLSRWNPFSTEVPYATFMEHPVKNSSQRLIDICQMSPFVAQLVQAVQNVQRQDPASTRTDGLGVVYEPILIETYTGLMSFIGNRNKLGYSLARGSVGF